MKLRVFLLLLVVIFLFFSLALSQINPKRLDVKKERASSKSKDERKPAQEVPIDMGSVEVSAPMMPGSFKGDVRNLPKASEWQPSDPLIEIPEGQLPNGKGDGWNIETNGEPPVKKSSSDPVLDTGDFDHADAFTPHVDFAGMGFTGAVPPDTVGDVGPNHYIQMINHPSGSQFQIWDKSGTSVAGPTVLSTLWTPGGACASGAGDPIVVYDPLADRWVMSEFASTGNHLCIYVSKTADPVSGEWWLYDFATPNFPDYPKYGVWPDAYYVSTYEDSTLGVYALDRTAMLNGQPATSQRFSVSSLIPSFFAPCTNIRVTRILPSDLDGTAPPAGTPNYFFRPVESCQDVSNPVDRLEIFEFDVDWTTPANSSFTQVATLTPADFALVPCSPGIRDCIPQPGTSKLLDALSNRPMHRLQYRNFGTYETLVTNQAVDAGSGVSGVRWYELRRSGSTWSIYQQGTYSPDTDHRWMGSIAMDGAGNMALGYSVSSSSVFPSIRYTGRQSDDTLGTMPESEVTLKNGSGSQTWTSRWGDYSAMSVDPTDDCTFWYTQEYMAASGNWATHVGSFSYASCTDYDDELAADFGTSGLWHYDGTFWSKKTSWDPGSGGLAGWIGGLAVDFDANGQWNLDGTTWSKKTSWDPGSGGMASWAGGLAVDFDGNGLWNFDGTTWSKKTSWDPGSGGMTGWAGGLAVDFDGNGLWNFDGTTWSKKTSWDPGSGGMAGWAGGLAVDFDGNGLWNFDGTTWSKKTSWDPGSGGMTGWAGGLAVDFDGNGLWNYNGTIWSKKTSWDPEGMSALGNGIAADFGINGLWYYDGITWSKKTNWDPENLTNVDLY